MDGMLVLIGCWLIADSICFVHGFKSFFFKAKTVEEMKLMDKIQERE
jgi:hypothetical protein